MEAKALDTRVMNRSLPVVVRDPANEVVIDIPTLQELGFGKAVQKVEMSKKLKVAYAKYGYVTKASIERFNDKLRAETLQEDENARRFKMLVFIKPQEYTEVPPPFVLDKMKDAVADGIFDQFYVAKIQNITEVKIKDPILFGYINGCSDFFFIAQWDDDVSVEDIVTA